MRKVVLPVLFITWFCLLSVQMAGVHLHIDAAGEHAGLHGTHVHESDNDGHDHTGDKDVSILEKAGPIWSKLIPIILACAALLSAGYWFQQRSWPLPARIAKPRRRSRWRPPLRAPPINP